jgi:hypothetical protein
MMGRLMDAIFAGRRPGGVRMSYEEFVGDADSIAARRGATNRVAGAKVLA